MSKSLGNIYTLDTLEEKGIEPIAYKLLCFSSHYRNKLNFTFDGVISANTSLIRLREGYQKHLIGTEKIDQQEIKELEEKFHKAINDDLNIPMAMSIVWDVIRKQNKSKQYAQLLLKFDQVLGLDIEKEQKEEEKLPEEIQELVNERQKARQEKNWEKSDQIRDIIIEKGYNIKDTKDGMIIEHLGTY